MVKNLPDNVRVTGSIPRLGRSHMPLGNSSGATTTEPMLWSPGLHNKRSFLSEKPKCLESSPRSLQLEESLNSNKDPAQPKLN